jgi:hypothetical protein
LLQAGAKTATAKMKSSAGGKMRENFMVKDVV